MTPGIRTVGAASAKLDHSLAIPESLRARILEVSSVSTTVAEQGQGHGSALMRSICDEADQDSMTLILSPKPYGASPMSRGDLMRWYQRFGFAVIQQSPEIIMARQPQFKPEPTAVAVAVSEAIH